MIAIIRKYAYLYISTVLLLLVTACADDLQITGQEIERIEGRPVEIEVVVNDYPGTRGLTDESKTSFAVGELIHIRAEFTLNDLDSPGQTKKEVQYGVMKYNGKGTWINFNTVDVLTWPGTAISGTFTAYYIYGSNGVLSNASNSMPPTLLSDYKFGQDPLYAQTIDVEYGHTIRFEMSHIFSYLTLTEMSAGISEELSFTIPKTEPEYENFHNAFLLEFDEATKEMTPTFLSIPSDTYYDNQGEELVFITSSTEIYETNDGDMKTKVGFFLEPSEYHKFSLLYPKSRDQMVSYLTYTRDLTALTPDQKGLLANEYYEFSILKSLGVYVDETPQDGWDDETDPHIIVDVESFLRAANAGTEYWEPDPDTGELVQILESTVAGTRLLMNVDFNHFYYDIFENENFVPNLSLTFDGNYHYIFHMAAPLFNENHGIITNVGFRDISTNADEPIVSSEKFEKNGFEYDLSRNGAITRYNFGSISNIRVDNVNLNVKIHTTGIDFDESSQEAHNVALLFGSNRGNIYDISLAGTLTLTVENYSATEIMPNVIIGGLAGQNLGAISRVGPIEDENFETPVYNIINKCQGVSGVYLVGGACGSSQGNLFDIMMSSLMVDGSESTGVESIMGGLVGSVEQSQSAAAEISGCIIRGSVISGDSRYYTNLNANSYTGGLAGLMNVQGIVKNCSASISVTGATLYDPQVTYGVGGAFGRIEQKQTQNGVECSIQTLACFGSSLSGLVNIGNFTGLAPEGYSWSNFDGFGINVKQYPQYQNIGGLK